MKRKFSFNLTPAMLASKIDLSALGPPTAKSSLPHAHSQTSSTSQSRNHTRQHSDESISLCDFSPYINRRVLDHHTELELRAACQLILENFKPSDHGMEDTDPKLDFNMGQPRREHRTRDRNEQRTNLRVRMPTGAPVDLKTALQARGLQQTDLTSKDPNAPPARANSSRKRADFAWLDDRDEKRAGNLRKSSSTSRKSLRDDHMDSQASEWLRGRQEVVASGRASFSVRPPSRARSFKESVKEYVFAGPISRSLSRKQSKDSLNTVNTDSSADATRSVSSAGWRSWNLGRKSSSRSSSRPGTSRGQEAEPPKKPENVINLNRELPPLPSLDSWKEPTNDALDKVQLPKSPISPNHIASLMKGPQETQDRATAIRNTNRRSGSDVLAVQYNTSHPTSRSPVPTKRHGESSSRSKTLTPDSLGTLDNMTLANSASTSNLSAIRQKSISSTGETTNFSRKMSLDVPRTFSPHSQSSNTKSHSGSHHSQSRSHKDHRHKERERERDRERDADSKDKDTHGRKDEQKSRLKKVFSGWMSKKEHKEKEPRRDDWMHRIEKEGVKEGMLVHEGGADAPVVRY